MHKIIIILSISFLLTNCNKKQTKSKKKTYDSTINITANDRMKFDINKIHIKAGEKITLTLKNTGKTSKYVMGHNWVLLKEGTKVSSFASKAASAKDTDYIPSGDNIVVHTKLIGGGESDTITFTIDQKGKYDYICSFPGHYGMMRGKLIVE